MILKLEKLQSISAHTKLNPEMLKQIIAETAESTAGLFFKLKESRDNVTSIVNCTDIDLHLIKHSRGHTSGKFVETPPPIIPGKTVGLFSSSKSSYTVAGNKQYVLYSITDMHGNNAEVLLYWRIPLFGDDAYWSAIAPGGSFKNLTDKEILNNASRNEKKGMIHCIEPSGGYGLCTFLRKGRIECAVTTREQMWWKEEVSTAAEELAQA